MLNSCETRRKIMLGANAEFKNLQGARMRNLWRANEEYAEDASAEFVCDVNAEINAT